MLVVTLDPSALSSSRNENEKAVKIRLCIAKIGLEIWPAQLPENKKKNMSSKFLGRKFSTSPFTSLSQLAMIPAISL